MTDLPIEMELLRACTRARLPQAEDENLEPLLPRVNWDHLLWLGRRQRVLLFVWEMLRGSQWANLFPSHIRDQLEALHDANQFKSLVRAREVCLLVALLEQHGIPALPVDAWTAAHSELGRPDLVEVEITLRMFVPGQDLARASEILAKVGHSFKREPKKLLRLGQSPVPLNEGLGAHPSAGRLWEQADVFELGGRNLHQLAPIHWLLHFLLQCSDSRPPKLAKAWEIVNLVQRHADWSWHEVLAEARQFQLDAAVASRVTLAYKALGLSVPNTVANLGSINCDPSSQGTWEAPKRNQAFSTVPFVPTPAIVAERMLRLAETMPEDVVYDLGCGDGQIVVMAAKKFGARGVGVDLDPQRIAEANARAAAQGVTERVSFISGDMFETSLQETSVLCLYLVPWCYPRILERLHREAKSGMRVVSHDTVFSDWLPQRSEIVRVGATKVSQIYLWRV